MTVSHGDRLPVGLCIWTIGLIPNPDLRSMGLPLTPDGQVLVDGSYRVQGVTGVYSIGDCTRIVDPRNDIADQMTCKEGGLQGERLGKIVMADLEDARSGSQEGSLRFFCIGLGKNRGLVWGRKRGKPDYNWKTCVEI